MTCSSYCMYCTHASSNWSNTMDKTFSSTSFLCCCCWAPLLGPQAPSSGGGGNCSPTGAHAACACVWERVSVCGVSLRVQSAQLAVVIDWGKKVSHNLVTAQRQHSRSVCVHAFTRLWLQISYYSAWTSQDWPPTEFAPVTFTLCALLLLASSSMYAFIQLQCFSKLFPIVLKTTIVKQKSGWTHKTMFGIVYSCFILQSSASRDFATTLFVLPPHLDFLRRALQHVHTNHTRSTNPRGIPKPRAMWFTKTCMWQWIKCFFLSADIPWRWSGQ